jgi:hypothetical protein
VSSQGTPTVQNAHQLEWERRDPANILTMESGGGGGEGEGRTQGESHLKKKKKNVIDMEKNLVEKTKARSLLNISTGNRKRKEWLGG